MTALHGTPIGHTRRRRGFTLIEMAIVLVIVGLLAGITLPLIGDLIKREKRSEAGNFLEKVKNEIIGYAIINKRLPASLSDIGVGDDPYGQALQYWVDSKLSSSDLCDNSPEDNLTLRYYDGPGASDNTEYGDLGFIVLSTGRNVLAEYYEPTTDTVRVWDKRYYVGHPDADPSSTSEEFDDIYEYVSYNYLKNKVCTNTANEQYTPNAADVSLGQDQGAFSDATVANPPGQDVGNVTLNDDGSIDLGNQVGGSASTVRGCLWYQGDSSAGNCVDGKCEFGYGFRAYFTFKHNNIDTDASSNGVVSGFTFAFIDGEDNASTVCGGSSSANMLGFAGGDVEPPKWAVEFDSYPLDTALGTKNDPPFNHAAIVWFADTDTTRAAWTTSNDDNRHYEYFNAIDPDLSDYHTGDRNARPPSNAAANETEDNDLRAVAFDTSKVTWLEDGNEHTVRIEIYRNATNGAYGSPSGSPIVNATVWIDCTTDCSDLSAPYAGGADKIVNQNATLLNNATGTGFQTYRFGWTQATGYGTGGAGNPRLQDLTISDFGIKFLRNEPTHKF